MTATPDRDQAKNMDFLLYLGELFTLVAYGQLIIETYHTDQIESDLVEQIFDVMIRDFSEFALKLYAKPVTTPAQMDCCMKMIQKPVTDKARFDRIWETHVMALKDTYDMTP
jgi:acyl-CoA dehydrogenase